MKEYFMLIFLDLRQKRKIKDMNFLLKVALAYAIERIHMYVYLFYFVLEQPKYQNWVVYMCHLEDKIINIDPERPWI